MILDEETGTVTFKSQSSFFAKERDNRKCFTVRMMTSTEWDQFWSFLTRHDDHKIEIQEACVEPVNSFTRWITDLTWEPRWGQYEVCISWRDERVDKLYGALRRLYDSIDNNIILMGDDRLAEAIDDAGVALEAART